MNKKEMLQLIVSRLSDDDRATVLDNIIANATDDATYDSYFDLSDALRGTF
jgi:hypothetical protein